MRGVPALEREPRGVAALRALARQIAPLEKLDTRRKPPAARAARSVREDDAAREGDPAGAEDRAWRRAVAPPGRELILFAGKGGVGKTTCATAAALGVAAREDAPRVLLLSTDPAHSLGDVLDVELGDVATAVPDAPPALRAREIDAAALFAARRRRYLETVDAVFEALRGGSRFDPTYDRVVVEDLIDLAPPGIDELLGILEVTAALGVDGAGPAYDVVVVDTAPTGHALRLLTMPEAALEWVHAFMTILLKYRSVMGLGELGQDLVTIARELRALQGLLRDRARAAVVAVTRAAELPRRETRRLLGELRALHVGVGAVIVNALTPPGCGSRARRCDRSRRCDGTSPAGRRAAALSFRHRRSHRRHARPPRSRRGAGHGIPANDEPPHRVRDLPLLRRAARARPAARREEPSAARPARRRTPARASRERRCLARRGCAPTRVSGSSRRARRWTATPARSSTRGWRTSTGCRSARSRTTRWWSIVRDATR
jgi:TRC40/GET3/ArsA family transport-energizing ATPase